MVLCSKAEEGEVASVSRLSGHVTLGPIRQLLRVRPPVCGSACVAEMLVNGMDAGGFQWDS